VETFVVRVFVPADVESEALCGLVQHVGSGRTESFRGPAALVHVVLEALDAGAEERTRTAPGSTDVPPIKATQRAGS
jgi:hypothetical protein